MKQYIVEWRPARAGEHYLFTDKSKWNDYQGKPVAPFRSNREDPSGIVRPVIVGTINPDTDEIFYLEDQV